MIRLYSLCNPWLSAKGIVSIHPDINIINLLLSESNKYLIQTKIVVRHEVFNVILAAKQN